MYFLEVSDTISPEFTCSLLGWWRRFSEFILKSTPHGKRPFCFFCSNNPVKNPSSSQIYFLENSIRVTIYPGQLLLIFLRVKSSQQRQSKTEVEFCIGILARSCSIKSPLRNLPCWKFPPTWKIIPVENPRSVKLASLSKMFACFPITNIIRIYWADL